jgi:hypothetical protein
LVDQPQPSWRIVRQGANAKVYGRAIPAFIHNGSYFYNALGTYADGAVDCWGYVDISLFREKLAQGWVVPQAKIGGTLSIHNLGQTSVVAAQWSQTPDDLEHEVLETIRDLNPTMNGLLDMEGTDTELRNGIRYAKGSGWGRAIPYRIALSGAEVMGDELPVLEVHTDGYRLLPWLIYADGLTQLGYGTELLSIAAVEQMFADGRLTLSIPTGAWLILETLGRVQAGEGYWWTEPGERIREAYDILDQLNGRPDAIGRCIEALRAYQSDPSEPKREVLRECYNAVPKHLRMYCGDMDSKDGPIRRILAVEDEADDE